MNNIAEGFERKSNNEFKYFINITKGFCSKIRSMLLLSKQLNKIEEKSVELYNLSEEIFRMLSGLENTYNFYEL